MVWYPAIIKNAHLVERGKQEVFSTLVTLYLLSYPSEHELFDSLWVRHSPLRVQEHFPFVQRWPPGYIWPGAKLHPLDGKTCTHFTKQMNVSLTMCHTDYFVFHSLTQVMSSKPGSSSAWGGKLGSWELRGWSGDSGGRMAALKKFVTLENPPNVVA